MFIDEADIHIKGGRGGDGCVSFRREKYRPHGGPDGGDGGPGGSVLIKASTERSTLWELNRKRHHRAHDGANGGSQNRTGARGSDLVIEVPTGTVVKDDSGSAIADLLEPGQSVNAAPGGRGGRGNASLATASRPLPGFAEKGEPGATGVLRLELKVVADVAIVGFPNAGKSCLIARISGAKPKIADYPFTTTEPNLGVVFEDDLDYVVTDVPGLVEGAHEGKGMGTAFLRHIERAHTIIYLLDMSPSSGREPAGELACLEEELELFNPELVGRRRLAAANKMDLNPPSEVVREVELECEQRGLVLYPVSAVTGQGVPELLRALATQVTDARREKPVRGASVDYGTVRQVKDAEPMEVRRLEDRYIVKGAAVERMVLMTDWNNDEALSHLSRRLRKAGVEEVLALEGAQPGDEVEIAGRVFEYIPEGVEAPGASGVIDGADDNDEV